jgi:hypothetical protein
VFKIELKTFSSGSFLLYIEFFVFVLIKDNKMAREKAGNKF